MNMERGKEDIEEKQKCQVQKADQKKFSEMRRVRETELGIGNSSQ